MSHGMSPIGKLSVDQNEGQVSINVSDWWSPSDSGVSVAIQVPDLPDYRLDISNSEARQVAALLLEAAGNKDLAEAIPEAMAEIERKRAAEELVWIQFRAAQEAAEKAFMDATTTERAAYNAAIDSAERDCGVHDWRPYRSVDIGEGVTDPFELL